MFGIGWKKQPMYQVTPMSPSLGCCLPGCRAAPLWGQHMTRGGQEGTATPYMDGLLGMADHLATSWE